MFEMNDLEKNRLLVIYVCKFNDLCYINFKKIFSIVFKIWLWNLIIVRNYDNRNYYIFMMISCILS